MSLRVVDSILDLIGSTPLLRLRRLPPPGSADVYVKLEYLNPGGSVKDRAALGMIRDAEARGYLKPGMTIIEPTAGNTGIGLALVGAQLGYKVILVVPRRYSREKMLMMRALGGTLVILPEEAGMQEAIAHAKRLAAETPGSYCPQQFENDANPEIHRTTTGREIWEALEGRVDAMAAGAGTGGTFTGIARFLKAKNPAVWCALVEPPGSVLGGGKTGPHKVEGIGNDFIPGTCDLRLANEVIMVPDEDSFATATRAARLEGIPAGGSGGANLFAALRLAERLGPGRTVVTLIPDSGERYLSKDLYGTI